jgi:hypothetical protein
MLRLVINAFWVVINPVRALYSGFGRYSPETHYRLIFSAHVRDLRWIAGVSFCCAGLAIATIIFLGLNFQTDAGGVTKALQKGAQAAAVTGNGGGRTAGKLYELLVPFQVSAVVGGLGAILAWCFQTGNVRLGTVDLFACEITTLCRIWTVDSVVLKCIDAYDIDKQRPLDIKNINERRERFTHFDSSEKYTPVFDVNAKELRNLSVKVLTNMTAFYTYWKATSDAYRNLAAVKHSKPRPQKRSDIDAWHGAMRHLIYMQFLTCESARKAVRDLIEFQPGNAENSITILLCELPAYGFLLKSFPSPDHRHGKPDHHHEKDVRLERLELRRERYKEVVGKLYRDVRSKHDEYKDNNTARENFPFLKEEFREELVRDWAKANGMLEELADRFERAIGEPLC